MRFLLVASVAVVLALAALSSLYTVDRAEYVYVTQFGRHLVTRDGASDGGLHWKLPWPIQSVQRLDRRLQYFDLPETELLTQDRQTIDNQDRQTIDKTITVMAYVCWRIAGAEGVDRLIRRGPEQAKANLADQIRSQLGAAIGKKKMDDLFHVSPQTVTDNLKELRLTLLSLKQRAREEYGIEIVDIRLRRTNHPEAVREAIFKRIRSEREKKAGDYEREGEKQAKDIISAADSKAEVIIAEGDADKKRLEGEADAEADRIRNLAQSKDVEFYVFLKKLEEYQRILGDNKTVLLLSSHRDLFDLFNQPPGISGNPVPRTGVAPGAPNVVPKTKDRE